MTFNVTQRSRTHANRTFLAKATKNIWVYPITRLLDHIRIGSLGITLPDGARIETERHDPERHASIVIHNTAALRKLILGGSIGFSESYISGDWTSPDLPKLIEVLALNGEALATRLNASGPLRIVHYLRHRLKRNSRRGSRNNIRYHYDLGNDFYARWLGKDMIYSSAIYSQAGETLDEAQRRKMDRIVELLDLSEKHKILEIGCGWGALSHYIAEHRKAHIRGITLSAEQLRYAQQAVSGSAVKNLITLDLTDYRDVRDTYDRIVSIEMIEAVGEEFLPGYFETIRDRLKPGGCAVIQAITIDEKRFDRYKSSSDFIQKYIFPGGFLTTKTKMRHYADDAGLDLCHAEFFGKSYALTLREWRAQFIANWPEISRLGYSEKFRNTWEFYLAYCEGGFNAGAIDVGLYVLKHKTVD